MMILCSLFGTLSFFFSQSLFRRKQIASMRGDIQKGGKTKFTDIMLCIMNNNIMPCI